MQEEAPAMLSSGAVTLEANENFVGNSNGARLPTFKNATQRRVLGKPKRSMPPGGTGALVRLPLKPAGIRQKRSQLDAGRKASGEKLDTSINNEDYSTDLNTMNMLPQTADEGGLGQTEPIDHSLSQTFIEGTLAMHTEDPAATVRSSKRSVTFKQPIYYGSS